MLPIQKIFINYNSSPRNEKASYIVIHDVGSISTAKNNRDYFASGDRGSSADFFIDSFNIIQIIDYHINFSWAIGDGYGKYGKTNVNSVNIEMCLESNYQPSEQTIQNTLDLTKYLMSELNIPIDNVCRHYDCSGKQCPRSFSANNWAKWYEFKSRLVGTPTTIILPPSSTQSTINKPLLKLGMNNSYVTELQNLLTQKGYDVGGIDGWFGQKTLNAVKQFQADNNLDIDGIAFTQTWNKLLASSAISSPTQPVSIPTSVLKFGDKGNLVKILQQALNKFGYGLQTDSDFGNMTKNAVLDFQRKHPPLDVDGICGKMTWTALLK